MKLGTPQSTVGRKRATVASASASELRTLNSELAAPVSPCTTGEAARSCGADDAQERAGWESPPADRGWPRDRSRVSPSASLQRRAWSQIA